MKKLQVILMTAIGIGATVTNGCSNSANVLGGITGNALTGEEASSDSDAEQGIKPTTETGTDTSGEKLTVDEPIMTGGAFLSCVTDQQGNADATPDIQIGCRFEKDGTKIEKPESVSVELRLWVDNVEAAIEARELRNNDEYDWRFRIARESGVNQRIGAIVKHAATGSVTEFRSRIQGIEDYIESLPNQIVLQAEKIHEPDTEIPAIHNFEVATTVIIPEFIEVNMGNAGNYRAEIRFDDQKCEYKGGSKLKSPMASKDPEEVRLGMRYEFDRCGDLEAGDTITVNSIEFKIKDGDRSSPIQASVNIEFEQNED